MPYRRLPNTDLARLRALDSAIAKAKMTPLKELAFSQAALLEAQNFYNKFRNSTIEQKESIKKQNQQSRDYNKVANEARIYLSHFIQVYNFCVIRGEIPQETRELYGFDPESGKIPAIQTDKDVIDWAEKIINGEKLRKKTGGVDIYQPKISMVEFKYKDFKQVYHSQQIHRQNTDRANKQVADLKKEADALILKIWNDVEIYFENKSDIKRRELCEEYGVVYVYRPQEKKRIEADKRQTKLDL